jgi:hypothetical protein
MNREVARKRPAEVRPTLPRPEIMSVDVHQKAVLLAEVHRMVRRGEIGGTYDLRHTSKGWAVKVIRIAERPSWWSRNGLKASLWSVATVGFLGAVAWLVRAVVILLAGALPYLIGGAVLLGLVSILGGSRVISIVQRVDIHR